METAQQLTEEIRECLDLGTLDQIHNKIRQAGLINASVDSWIGKTQLGLLVLLRRYTINGGGAIHISQ